MDYVCAQHNILTDSINRLLLQNYEITIILDDSYAITSCRSFENLDLKKNFIVNKWHQMHEIKEIIQDLATAANTECNTLYVNSISPVPCKSARIYIPLVETMDFLVQKWSDKKRLFVVVISGLPSNADNADNTDDFKKFLRMTRRRSDTVLVLSVCSDNKIMQRLVLWKKYPLYAFAFDYESFSSKYRNNHTIGDYVVDHLVKAIESDGEEKCHIL